MLLFAFLSTTQSSHGIFEVNFVQISQKQDELRLESQ